MREYPSCLNFSKKELNFKVEKLFKILKDCEICPRKCRVNRLKGERGHCRLVDLLMVSAFYPHFGEESVLVGEYGSGTIFFTSCNLSCLYCQNYDIFQLRIGSPSQILPGKTWEGFERLAEMIFSLQERGCHNINLVTPTPQVSQIVKALSIAIEKGLKIPLVYNTSSYAPNYFGVMKKVIKEMHHQVGDLKLKITETGTKELDYQGLIIRHLVLPNNLAGSEKIFEFIAKEISPHTFLNIMEQYFPDYKAFRYPEFSRRITNDEYQEVIKLAKKFGLNRLYL